MHLDAPTMFVIMALVAMSLGCLLLLGWLQNRVAAVAWWSAAQFVAAAGLICFALGGAWEWRPLTGAALVAMALYHACNLTGARLFCGRPMWAGHLIWPPAIVLEAILLWTPEARETQLALGAAMTALSLLAAGEFWRGRAEKLMGRCPLMVILALQGGFAAVVAVGQWQDHGSNVWRLAVSIEAMVSAVGIAVLCLLMSKERIEREFRRAAATDPLTGLRSRGAFISHAERAVARNRQDRAPVAVLMIDLDHFKKINDRHGHAEGDHVLRIFANVVTSSLRPKDLVGRLGGEEFALLLAGVTPAEAVAAAESIRRAFAGSGIVFSGSQIASTVSLGVAYDAVGRRNLDLMLACADKALYRAKANGRDRVELSVLPADGGDMADILPLYRAAGIG